MIRSIAYPTDLSPESQPAFEAALRMALLHKSEFALLHVCGQDEEGWDSFPGVRETMARWGFLEPQASAKDVYPQTGVTVRKYEIFADSVINGLVEFLRSKAKTDHSPDLLVMSSHGRAGLGAMLNPSVAGQLAHLSMLPTMIFGPLARPFVDTMTGKTDRIKTIMVAVDHEPSAQMSLRPLWALAEGLPITFDFVHIGDTAPVLYDREKKKIPVRLFDGPVVETLLEEVEHVDLLAMPMVGRDGLLDALRGSTTEQIVAESIRPVLALPA